MRERWSVSTPISQKVDGAAPDISSPVYLPSILKVVVRLSQDCQGRRIATFSIEDLLQVFWIFYAVQKMGGEKRKMVWFEKGINNKSSMRLSKRLLKKPNLTHPSCSNFYFISSLDGETLKRRNLWMIFTSGWYNLVKQHMSEVPSVPKMHISLHTRAPLQSSLWSDTVLTCYAACVCFCPALAWCICCTIASGNWRQQQRSVHRKGHQRMCNRRIFWHKEQEMKGPTWLAC